MITSQDIIDIRKNKQWSQRRLAKELGVSNMTINRAERNGVKKYLRLLIEDALRNEVI